MFNEKINNVKNNLNDIVSILNEIENYNHSVMNSKNKKEYLFNHINSIVEYCNNRKDKFNNITDAYAHLYYTKASELIGIEWAISYLYDDDSRLGNCIRSIHTELIDKNFTEVNKTLTELKEYLNID